MLVMAAVLGSRVQASWGDGKSRSDAMLFRNQYSAPCVHTVCVCVCVCRWQLPDPATKPHRNTGDSEHLHLPLQQSSPL